MMVFPGDIPPSVRKGATMEENGWRTTLLSFSSHTGTHMDAPSHMIKDGNNLDQMPNETFFGFGLVVDVRGCAGRRIELADIKVTSSQLAGADFLLFRTDWDKKWGTEDYFGAFPCITSEVADFIVASGKKGVGLDVISIDPISDSKLENHKIILSQNTIVIIENLCNLKAVGSGLFTLIVSPLKFENADGAPIRSLAIID